MTMIKMIIYNYYYDDNSNGNNSTNTPYDTL